MRKTLPVLLALPVLFLFVAFASRAADSDEIGAGITLNTRASGATAIGLPIYPGATLRRDDDDDEAALNLGIWGGRFGFRLHVLQLASSEQLSTVADYYRDQMARFGNVLTCTSGRKEGHRSHSDSKGLTCDDEVEPGELVLKVGTEGNQRIVSLKRVGDTLHVDLARLQFKND
ncbi:MAG: hypothetical protein ABSF50_15460 [Burkholderiaceae bacterium]|jgi:hypothetical protein